MSTWINLEKSLSAFNHESVSRITIEMLNSDSEPLSESDLEYLRELYLISLLKLSKFDEFVKTLESENFVPFHESFIFELAYSFYRIGKYNECRVICEEKINDPILKVKFACLLAQVNYREGSYEQALKFYMNDFSSYLYSDVNVSAIFAATNNEQLQQKYFKYQSSSSHYEILFNQACLAMNNNQLHVAKTLLADSESNLFTMVNYSFA